MDIGEIIARHSKIALEFSGGKDSLAVLYLLEPFWDRIIVAWVNTGDAFPETLAQMEEIKAMVPHFVELKSDQPGQIRRNGWPTDVLSVWDTRLGRLCQSGTVIAQSTIACCGENLWSPMQAAIDAAEITLVIRGQRSDEFRKGPISSGQVVNGVEYLFPIEGWTGEEVKKYLGPRLPKHYEYLDSSLDCQHCTAHLNKGKGRLNYLRERHANDLYPEVKKRISVLLHAAELEIEVGKANLKAHNAEH